jgi:hypothetical protein
VESFLTRKTYKVTKAVYDKKENGMKQVTAPIEQDRKYISDSENGSEPYRQGYVRALEAVKEFLKLEERSRTVSETRSPVLESSASFGPFQPRDRSVLRANTEFELAQTLTVLEKEALEIALGVLRSKSDYGDFLNSWLRSYGARVLSPDPPSPLVPDSEAVLEDLHIDLEPVMESCTHLRTSTMKGQPSFGIIGLTRTELEQQRRFLDASRGFSGKSGNLSID